MVRKKVPAFWVPVEKKRDAILGVPSLKLNIAPEKWWLEDDPFLLGR